MNKEKHSLSCTNNQTIEYATYSPDQRAKACIIIVHGLAEHIGRYEDTASFLTKNGYSVLLPELMGHELRIPADKLGLASPTWFRKQVFLLHELVQNVKETHRTMSIYLMGHSMGSFICQDYAQHFGNTIEGLILSASNGKEDPLLGVGIFMAKLQHKLFGTNHRSKLIDKLSFGRFNKMFAPNRTSHDWLSRDDKEVDKYVADPRCGFVCGAGFFAGLFMAVREVMKHSSITNIPENLPVYCIAGSADPVGLMGKGFLQLIEKWKKAGIKIDYKLYEDGRHEMLNEINREEVREDLMEWLNKKIIE